MEKGILIYTSKRTSRLFYVLTHIFENRLGQKFSVTTSESDFDAFDGIKVNYSLASFENALQIVPSKILFEKRLEQDQVEVQLVDGLPLLFPNSTKSIKHDVFGAVFYFLSRYEEYLPNRKDEHGRFISESSLASKHGVIHVPVVDHYILRFCDVLNSLFEGRTISPKADFRHLVTLDIDQLFLYKAKGLARTVFGLGKDAVSNRSRFLERSLTLIGKKPDPLDIYGKFLNLLEEGRTDSIMFFQVGDGSRFDINNPVHLPLVRSRINELSLRTNIGIHPSYFSSENDEILRQEFARFNAVSSVPLRRSRQHYLRFEIPSTYRILEDLGIEDDYSMAFADTNGFRASTAFQFRFYDLERDEITKLTVHPTAFLDITSVRKNRSEEACIDELDSLWAEVKKVGGTFITVWHPEVLLGLDVPLPSQFMLDYLIKSAD